MQNRNKSLFETDYSEKALNRLKIIEKYTHLIKSKCKKSVALAILEVSRATLTRWKKQLRQEGIAGLEDYSRRPKNIRKSTWTQQEKLRVHNIRKLYPFFGKAKIAVIYSKHYQENIATSRVGKILKQLLLEYKISTVADVCGKKYTKPRVFDGHAKRLPKGMKAKQVGELIQIDQMSVNISGLKPGKHFNAICPISKYAVAKTYWQATSHNAENFLKFLIKSLPFPILSLQVDGGSEFKGDFEIACAKLNIPLFVLPPRSPEMNGCVERVNGTFKDEFYAMYLSFKSIDEFKMKLTEFIHFYNGLRPHHNLRLLTPYEFLEKLKLRGPGLICIKP